MNTTSSQSNPLSPEPIANFGNSLALSLTFLFIFLLITYASYKCRRVQTPATTNRSLTSVAISTAQGGASAMAVQQKGLDEATISSYPNLNYVQLKTHNTDAAMLGCSICLAEYKDTDLIRLLPDCGHFFHRNCVDRWLMLHPTCPVCRTSPLQIQ